MGHQLCPNSLEQFEKSCHPYTLNIYIYAAFLHWVPGWLSSYLGGDRDHLPIRIVGGANERTQLGIIYEG